jgi:hypothetical protein
MELMMEFKLNARSISWDDRDNTHWLLKAGYEEEDITDEMKAKFKKCYSYLLLNRALELFPSSKEDAIYTSFEHIWKTIIKQ